MKVGKGKRKDVRKFKRVKVRYGPERPVHLAYGIQISESGAFLAANRPIFAKGSRIVLEFDTPAGKFRTDAVVRHAKSLPPQLTRLFTSGMGVEFLAPPKELVDYIASL